MGDEVNRLVWIDTETTGLNPSRDDLLEVAVVITNPNLQVVGEPYDAVVEQWSVGYLKKMNDFVVRMHTENGLIDDIRNGKTKNVSEIESDVLSLFGEYGVNGNSPLAGSSVHFDRQVLKHNLSRVESALHYRNVDVSTVKVLTRLWDHPAQTPPTQEKDKAHRALDDIMASIEELRYYRENIFA